MGVIAVTSAGSVGPVDFLVAGVTAGSGCD